MEQQVKVKWPTQFLDVGWTQMATEMYNKNRDKFDERMKRDTQGKPKISIKEFRNGFSGDRNQPKEVESKKQNDLEPKQEDVKEETVQETKEEVKEEPKEKKTTSKKTKKSWWGKK